MAFLKQMTIDFWKLFMSWKYHFCNKNMDGMKSLKPQVTF